MSKELTKKEYNIPAVETTYKELFQEMTSLDENDVIMIDTCNFCRHPLRAQAEEMYEESGQKGYMQLIKFFQQHEAEYSEFGKINSPILRNHLKNHYLQQERRLQLKTYADRLQLWTSYKIKQDEKFNKLQGMMEMLLADIASSEDLGMTKKADAITKLCRSILDVVEIQAKLRGEINTTQLMGEKLKQIWVNVIKEEPRDEVRRGIAQALELFMEQAKGIDFSPEK